MNGRINSRENFKKALALPTLGQRQAFRSDLRRRQAESEATEILNYIHNIDAIIQVGLGAWMEGSILLNRFPSIGYFAIEPVRRYCDQAKERGFPGEIKCGAAWNETGIKMAFEDHREKTSAFRNRKGRPDFEVPTFRLDDIYGHLDFSAVFLWVDAEGSELQAIMGCQCLLRKCKYVLAELTRRKIAGRIDSQQAEVAPYLSGFVKIQRIGATDLFVRA